MQAEQLKLTFKKRDSLDGYLVFNGKTLIGSVKRLGGWTDGGRAVTWQASRMGISIGRQQETRAAAAALLIA